jgi:hypothetical protein
MALPSARLVKRKKDVMKACATFCGCTAAAVLPLCFCDCAAATARCATFCDCGSDTVAAVLPLCFCNYASAAALRHLDCAALGMTMRHDN